MHDEDLESLGKAIIEQLRKQNMQLDQQTQLLKSIKASTGMIAILIVLAVVNAVLAIVL